MTILETILREIQSVLTPIDEAKLEEVANEFKKDVRVFVDGEGRSGLMAKAFAMRLMHIGYTVFAVGETVTPALQAGDMHVAISGSGETRFVLAKAEQAKKTGCWVLAVTGKQGSTLAALADQVLLVPATTKGDNGEERKSIQLLGSLFDQSLHIVLDGLCLFISQKDGVTHEVAVSRHSVLE